MFAQNSSINSELLQQIVCSQKKAL